MYQDEKEVQDSLPTKPGNKIYRPARIKGLHLRRVLGIPGLFSIGYGDVGSSIYYGLGVVAIVALGATPIALAVAGIVYIFNALTYAEGSSMFPEGGGSASYARHGFNDLIGFLSGWALMLSYIVTMAISAYTIPPYLAYFWPMLREPVIGTLVSMGIILFLMIINIFGIKESSRMNIMFIVLDVCTQLILVLLGIILILRPHPETLFRHMFGQGNWPSTQSLIFGIALAALCFTGVESVSQHGEETRRPEKRIPQTYIFMIVAVLVLFAGISIAALSAMTPQELGDPVNGWARDPVAGIADGISRLISPEVISSNLTSEPAFEIILTWIIGGLRNLLPVLVALLAASILLTATNAGLLGISRLTYNLASNQQLPESLKKVHHSFRTPFVSIILFCLISIALLVPGLFAPDFFTDLGSLYVFGSLLCFALAHASILALRIKRPDMDRPFKLRGNIRIKECQLPVTALLGLAATTVIWIVILVTQPYSRWAGFIWMFVGVLVYLAYRRIKSLPIFHLPSKVKIQMPESKWHM
jgi:APA family basic amino acid/polyamine antiporter